MFQMFEVMMFTFQAFDIMILTFQASEIMIFSGFDVTISLKSFEVVMFIFQAFAVIGIAELVRCGSALAVIEAVCFAPLWTTGRLRDWRNDFMASELPWQCAVWPVAARHSRSSELLASSIAVLA